MDLERETEEWLKQVAETCIAHMKHVEAQAEADVDLDDQGLYQLDKAFLTLYSLYVKGDIPRVPGKQH